MVWTKQSFASHCRRKAEIHRDITCSRLLFSQGKSVTNPGICVLQVSHCWIFANWIAALSSVSALSASFNLLPLICEQIATYMSQKIKLPIKLDYRIWYGYRELWIKKSGKGKVNKLFFFSNELLKLYLSDTVAGKHHLRLCVYLYPGVDLSIGVIIVLGLHGGQWAMFSVLTTKNMQVINLPIYCCSVKWYHYKYSRVSCFQG